MKLALLVLVFVSVPAMAYVDPGSGYMLWQFIAGTAAGTFFGLFQWLRRLVKDKGKENTATHASQP